MIRMHSTRSGLFRGGLPVILNDGEQEPYDDDGIDSDEELTEEPSEDGKENAYFNSLFSSSEEKPETTEMLIEGRLITTTHRVELIYEEMLLDDFGTSVTKIGFDRACPDMITLLRNGAVNTALVFENKKRHICIYNVPAAGFEVCISTVSVQNHLLTDGTLTLDYYMEVHGIQTDHCILELSISDTESF